MGAGGAPVIKGNEASDDKVTISVNLGDLPSPPGEGIKGEKGVKGLFSDLSEALGFTKKAVDKVEEVQNKPESSTWKDSENYDGLEYNTQRTHDDSVTYKNDNSETKTVHQNQVNEKKEIVFD